MEVYDYSVETEGFVLRFRDDFDTLDSRWVKGDFSYGPTKFTPENVYVKDGKLVLKVEKEQGPDGSDSGSANGGDSGSNDNSSDD